MAALNCADYPSSLGCSPAHYAPAASHITTQFEYLPDGHAGTFRALEGMAQAVRGEIGPDFSGFNDPAVQQFAAQLTRAAHGSDRDEIAALYDFTAHRIKYLEHPKDQQVIQDALRTIQIGSGDCVSLSVLLATLLLARGIPARLVAQYTGDEDQYSHVYVEAQMRDGAWFPLDPVASDKPMGWRQPLCDGCFETTQEIF